MADVNKTIQSALKNKKLIIGTNAVIKHVKNGEVTHIFYSSNIPESLRNNLEHYKERIDIAPFEGDSVRLGQICGKPFKILTVGIKK